EAGVPLQFHGRFYGLVLLGSQLGGVDAAGLEVVAGGHQRGRAEQAADVIGAERRDRTGHGSSSFFRRLLRAGWRSSGQRTRLAWKLATRLPDCQQIRERSRQPPSDVSK